MNDSLLMRRLQRRGNLLENLQRLLDRQGTLLEPLGKVLALDQFQDQEPEALVLIESVDRTDVRMIELGQCLGLPFKPGQAFGVLGKRLRQHLDRHLAVQLRIGCPVNITHPALTELGGDFVMGDGGSDH